MSYLDQIEEVKQSDLSAEEKKKAIRKLRRQMRKSQQTSDPVAVIDPELAKLTEQEMLDQLIESSGLEQGDPKVAHFYYSVAGCIHGGIPYEDLHKKFVARWNIQPRTYVVHKQGMGLYFGIGPTR